jgi:hypothetical protein
VFSRNFLFCVFLGARFPTVSTFSVNRWFYFSLALERPREACGFKLTHYRPKTQQAKGFTGGITASGETQAQACRRGWNAMGNSVSI